MGDNQSDNSLEWETNKVVRGYNSIHVDGTIKYVPTTVTYTSPNGPFTEIDITKFRFHIEDGRAHIVLDIDNIPTYSFTLGRKQTSELLQQLYNKQNE